MENNVVEKMADVGINFTHFTNEVSKAKVLLEDALEDGKRKAERTLKRGKFAAEECIEDTTYFIKRHPWESVGVALGFGAGIGLLAGWFATRTCAKNDH